MGFPTVKANFAGSESNFNAFKKNVLDLMGLTIHPVSLSQNLKSSLLKWNFQYHLEAGNSLEAIFDNDLCDHPFVDNKQSNMRITRLFTNNDL